MLVYIICKNNIKEFYIKVYKFGFLANYLTTAPLLKYFRGFF